jgi:putative endonuclease
MRCGEKKFYVYILTNIKKTVYYTGVTNDLSQRLVEHYLSRGNQTSFTGKYHVHFLIYYLGFKYVNDAIAFEKEIKGWRREKKISLIKSFNPKLIFLNTELLGEWPPSDNFHR